MAALTQVHRKKTLPVAWDKRGKKEVCYATLQGLNNTYFLQFLHSVSDRNSPRGHNMIIDICEKRKKMKVL